MINDREYNFKNVSSILEKLSDTELEVLLLIKKGLSSSQVAESRGCSPRTVEKHRSNIIKKLQLKSSQNSLVIWIIKHQSFFII